MLRTRSLRCWLGWVRLAVAAVSIAVWYLTIDEVTRVELAAIAELTHQELRGDRMFSIFLVQGSSASRNIEAELSAAASGHVFVSAAVRAISEAS